MNRQTVVYGGVVGALAAAAVGLWWVRKHADDQAAAPAWLNPGQPPDGVAEPLTAAQSWAANRCTPMADCCESRTAGMRIRRTYDPSLALSDNSFIRASFGVGAGL